MLRLVEPLSGTFQVSCEQGRGELLQKNRGLLYGMCRMFGLATVGRLFEEHSIGAVLRIDCRFMFDVGGRCPSCRCGQAV